MRPETIGVIGKDDLSTQVGKGKRKTFSVVANQSGEHNGVEFKTGEPLKCRCGQCNNWSRGGHKEFRTYDCSHGPVENFPAIEDRYTIPIKKVR